MPYRKGYGRTRGTIQKRKKRMAYRKGRRYGKFSKGTRNGNTRASTAIFRWPTTLPDEVIVKLPYSDAISQTSNTGAIKDLIWRGNSLFDPDLSGTGHQPRGYDQWAQFYSYYTVLGSSFEVYQSFAGAGGGVILSQAVNITIYPSLSSSTNVVDVPEIQAEQPYAKQAIGNIYQAGYRQQLCKTYMATSKIYGESNQAVRSEDNYAAAIAANPVDGWYWHLVWQIADGVTTATHFFTVKMVFYVRFNTRVTLAES